MCDEDKPFALIVVDSIMALFRVDYNGRGELSERQQVLGKTLSKLQKLSEEFNVAVLLTNQVRYVAFGYSFIMSLLSFCSMILIMKQQCNCKSTR